MHEQDKALARQLLDAFGPNSTAESREEARVTTGITIDILSDEAVWRLVGPNFDLLR